MGKPPSPKFIPGFTSLAPQIFIKDVETPPTVTLGTDYAKSLYSGQTSIKTTNTSDTQGFIRPGDDSPDIILITSWTGAQPRHIAKYTATYADMYPYSPIMVVTTSIDDLAFKSMSQKITSLAPAVGFLQGRTSQLGQKNGILLHAFSEGGANKAVCIAKAFLKMTGRQIPIGAYVFDSTPGTPRFGNNLAAFKRSLHPNPLLLFFGLMFGFVVLSITWVVFCVFVGFENNAISKTRKALNDPNMWPLRGVPRTYVFSEMDDLIWWKDVEEHAEVSANDPEVGVTSLVVRYKKSGHCSHLRENEEYYWGVVRQTWETRDVEIGLGGLMAGAQNLYLN